MNRTIKITELSRSLSQFLMSLNQAIPRTSVFRFSVGKLKFHLLIHYCIKGSLEHISLPLYMSNPPIVWLNILVGMLQGFPGGSVVKNLPANAGDAGSIPQSGRSPGEGNGNPLHYSCLGNPMERLQSTAGLQSTGLQRVGNDWADKHAGLSYCTQTSCRELSQWKSIPHPPPQTPHPPTAPAL